MLADEAPRAARQADAEHDRRAGQAHHQALPQAARSGGFLEPVGEAEAVAHRQADAPVGEQGHDHRHPGVLVAAQGPGGGDLQGVGELEQRGEHDQRGGDGDHRRVRRIHRGDLLAQQQHQARRDAGVAQRRGHPHAGGEARVARQAGAEVVADPHGHRHPQRIGNHEHQRAEVQGDLVAGHHVLVEPADQQGDHREDARLGEHRDADRQADRHQRADGRAIRPLPAREQLAGAVDRGLVHPEQHAEKHEPHHRAGGPAAAGAAHLRHAEVAVDQRVVDRDVQQQPADPQHHARPGPSQAVGVAA